MVNISIIVTSYNTSAYIKKCLDSLTAQTIDNIEILMADDASSDNTRDIIECYAQKYDHIKLVFSQQNRGPGGIRNLALEKVQGEYVAFIDSDDWLDINFAENLYRAAQNTNADILTCGLIREYDYKTSAPIYKCYYDKLYTLTGETAFRIMTNEYQYGIKYLPSALNKIYKTSFLRENNLSFVENIYFEDQPFSYQTTLKADKIVCVPNTLYHHYKRNGSIVQSFSKRNIDDMVLAYTCIKEFLVENDVFETFRFNYYSSLDHFYNLLVRQIFEFVIDENQKKEYLKYSLVKLKTLINLDEYIDYCSAEELRKHIQPNIKDTTIY